MDSKTKELVVRVQQDPQNVEALKELREHLEIAGMPAMLAKVLEWWAGAIDDGELAAGALVDAGRALVRAERDAARAVDLFKRAIERSAGHMAAHEALAEELGRSGRGAEYQSFIEERIGAVGPSPEAVTLYGRLGKFLRGAGDIDAAIAAYEEGLKLAPAHTAVAYDLAESLLTRHRARPQSDGKDATRAADLLVQVATAVSGERGSAYLGVALDHVPGHLPALHALVELKPATSQIPRLERALELVGAEDQTTVRLYLAKAYAELERFQDAINVLGAVTGQGQAAVEAELKALREALAKAASGDLLGMLQEAAQEDMRASLESGAVPVLGDDDLVLEDDERVELGDFPMIPALNSPTAAGLDEVTVIDTGITDVMEAGVVVAPLPRPSLEPALDDEPLTWSSSVGALTDGEALPDFGDDGSEDDGPMVDVPSDSLRLPDGSVPAQPPPVARRRVLFVHMGAAGGSLLVHMIGILGLLLMVNTFGIDLQVEDRTQEELYAEGLIERPERPPPEERPPPPPPRRRQEEQRPPTDRRVRLPETLQKVLRRVDRERTDQNQADRLLSAFAGEGSSLSEVTTNIDAIAGGAQSGALRLGGTLSALEGVSGVNVGTGGGGDIGTIGGQRAVKGAGRLAERNTGPVRGRVRAVAGLSRVSGSLSRGEVQAVINRYVGRIRRCYETGLTRNPGLGGNARFAWTITGAGGVSGVRSQGGSMADPSVVNCISGVIRRMRFPRPQGGSVQIVYPFMFQRGQ